VVVAITIYVYHGVVVDDLLTMEMR